MTTTSEPTRLSTIFSGKPQRSPPEGSGPKGTEGTLPKRLSLRVLLLLIFAVALSPVLVIGGIRWSGDIERDAERRHETMKLVAQEAATRADYMLESAPAVGENSWKFFIEANALTIEQADDGGLIAYGGDLGERDLGHAGTAAAQPA